MVVRNYNLSSRSVDIEKSPRTLKSGTTRTDTTIKRETDGNVETQRLRTWTTKDGKTTTRELPRKTSKGDPVVEPASEKEPALTGTLFEKDGFSYERGGEKLASGEKDLGRGVKAEGSIEGPKFSMSGDASGSVSTSGLDVDVNLKIDANLVSASGSVSKEFKFDVNGEEVKLKLELGANGNVGINGELKLKLHIGTDGKVSLTASGDGFAGARGSLSGTMSLSVNNQEIASGNVSVGASIGAGAGAYGEASYKDGQVKFRAGAYASIGAGISADVAGTVNLKNLAGQSWGLLLPGKQG